MMDRILASTIQKSGFSEPVIVKTLKLFDDGNTIPFIARYRKENTGGLDEVELRTIREVYDYCTELEERRTVVLKSIATQGKLTPELKNKILAVDSKQVLEDCYLPFKPKRKTRDSTARALGLEPAALSVMNGQEYQPAIDAARADHPELSEAQCLNGALDIIAAMFSENGEIVGSIRDRSSRACVLASEVHAKFKEKKTKFMNYYDMRRPLGSISAHALLAMRRGEKEGVLKVTYELPDEDNVAVIHDAIIPKDHRHRDLMERAAADAYNRLIKTRTEVDLRLMSKQKADEDSTVIFAENLKNLLLSPYAGEKWVIGVDPGFRSGSKLVVLDGTGKLEKHLTIYPVEPQCRTKEAEAIFDGLLKTYPIEFVCIGNGTASRELFDFVSRYLKQNGHDTIKPVTVNEAGASIYSASDISRKEFPDLDLTYRGAVSIARRFQDPLAELVKIDPRSVGVGQYQHDIDKKKLTAALHDVVEHCVNFVGVNLNTSSAPLLSYVSGLSGSVAETIVKHREKHGKFKSRRELMAVSRLGDKIFEQCAGFLRIPDSNNPLDNSAVHPERYGMVENMATDAGVSVGELIDGPKHVDKITPKNYTGEGVGEFTVHDIIAELKKPGRDPREFFVGAVYADNVKTINDVYPGLKLEGTVTNITKFGAFVDIGIHRDGLIHLSEMANRYIQDPAEICKVNQIVTVRITDVDKERGRISLSLRLNDSPIGTQSKKSAAPKHSKNDRFAEKTPEKKTYRFTSPEDFQNQFNARFNRDR